MLSHILLIAKYHIFATSVCSKKPDFEHFLSRLRSKAKVLYETAVANKNLEEFLAKWAPVM